MSAPPLPFIPPPPPGACVPTRPPGAVTPKFQKKRKGGLQLDMTDMFPGNKNAKKAIPPWERRKKAPPGGAKAKGKSKVPALHKTPPPKVRAKKGIPAPSQHKTPATAKPSSSSAPGTEVKPTTPSPATASPVTASPLLPANVAAAKGSPDMKKIQVPTSSGAEVKPAAAATGGGAPAPAVERTLLPLTATSNSTTTASPPPPTTTAAAPGAIPPPVPAPATANDNGLSLLSGSGQSNPDFGETQRYGNGLLPLSMSTPGATPTGANISTSYPFPQQLPSGQVSTGILSLAGSDDRLPGTGTMVDANGMQVPLPNPYYAPPAALGGAAATPAAAAAPAGPISTDVLAPAAATEPVIEPRIIYNKEVQEIVTKPFPASYTQLLKQERKALLEKIKTDKAARKAYETAQAEKKKKLQQSGAEKENEAHVIWRNVYDFQPSPSSALHDHNPPLAHYAATSSTSRHPVGATSAAAAAAAKDTKKNNIASNSENRYKYRKQLLPQEEAWRGVHWQHVDVHRYVARRYFGMPPPAEE